jgi:hypothetical protein
MAWIVDPKNKEASVSLTLLVVSLILLIIVGGLQVAKVIESVSIFPEMFYSSVALYFGRKMNVSGKLFSSEKAEQVEQKLKE